MKLGAQLVAHALARGLIVRLFRAMIGICPPLIITEAQIDELFDALAEAVQETERQLGLKNLGGAPSNAQHP